LVLQHGAGVFWYKCMCNLQTEYSSPPMRESAWFEVPEVTNEISGYMIEQEQ
jgi:hypothetical protein